MKRAFRRIGVSACGRIGVGITELHPAVAGLVRVVVPRGRAEAPHTGARSVALFADTPTRRYVETPTRRNAQPLMP